ncbi:ThuA domain-containing protein [Algoriphagus sp. NG3]|uniref:ThuA domain-containing protein n=2 Tax=unclassified Algoriphagus TaxID=2641541 RepID=UPI002A8084E0|nr:ThuA domain-containing protein [Algoriphagus sp. NG3]WPR76584.1 ThuA domain-containing protein [Algoriphagus sp. NG3]
MEFKEDFYSSRLCLRWFYLLIAFGLCLCMSMNLSAQTQSTHKALIVDGFSNHDWKQTTAVIRWILESSGKFKVDVSTVPLDSIQKREWNPDFKSYAVVIQNSNNIHDLKLSWPEPAQKSLERYVQNGGGLYILHSANNAFPNWKEYDKMIGLGWRSADSGIALEVNDQKQLIKHARGEGKGTSHGDRFDALIQLLNPHPINEGYPASWKTVNTEVYSYPRGTSENLTILSYAYDSTDTKKMWPVEWVVKYGKGNVYNSSMGHLWRGETFPPAYRCAGFQTTVIRAAEWLASGKVTYPVPVDFPTSENYSLRPKGMLGITENE